MMNIYITNDNPYLIVGDIHGQFNEFCHYLLGKKIFSDINVIICGDFGIGFYKTNYYTALFKRLNKKLSAHGINIYAFRGNHDDPAFFENEKLKEKVLNGINTIHLIDDYDIIKNSNHTILCIGGARSIDKCNRWEWDFKIQRKVPYGWWEGEKIKDIPNIFDRFIEDNKLQIDTICSHSAPDFCEPFNKDGLNIWAKYDDTLIDDCNKERELLTSIYNRLSKKHPIKYWFYGHFHKSYLLFHNDVRFSGLDMYTGSSKLDSYFLY